MPKTITSQSVYIFIIIISTPLYLCCVCFLLFPFKEYTLSYCPVQLGEMSCQSKFKEGLWSVQIQYLGIRCYKGSVVRKMTF